MITILGLTEARQQWDNFDNIISINGPNIFGKNVLRLSFDDVWTGADGKKYCWGQLVQKNIQGNITTSPQQLWIKLRHLF